MSNLENMHHDDEDAEFDVPAAFTDFIEGKDLWPAYADQWEDVDAIQFLPGRVFHIITEVLMDVKAGLDSHRFGMVHRMPLPSGQQSYIIREEELFEIMRYAAARVCMIADTPENDDGLPF